MPQVTSPPPRQPRQAPEAAPVRPRPTRFQRYDKTGYLVPTALEIEEGEAHKAMCEMPRSRLLLKEWEELTWRLYEEQGPPCTTRCAECHVVAYGRHLESMGCGYCCSRAGRYKGSE